jgi:UDP-2,3-diacylglucosamine pyrophosphatase LpxH
MLEKIGKNLFQIKHSYKNGDQFKYLLAADVHWDNPDANQDLFTKHLKECRESGAIAFIIGDFFCAMQGKYDKRSDKSKLRPEHQTPRYLDSLVETAAEYLMPFREQIGLISHGNHETGILRHHETDLIARLVERLNAGRGDSEHYVQAGSYGGYIKFKYELDTGGGRKSLLMKYHHGHGGGGPVTKGVIQSQRIAAYASDADIVLSGHVHEEYLINFPRERVDDNGHIYLADQWHVRTATYKDEYKTGAGGYHIESGRPPKPIGAWWMQTKVVRDRSKANENNHCVRIEYDFLKAK